MVMHFLTILRLVLPTILLACGCTPTGARSSTVAAVYGDGDTIVFNGPINAESATRFEAALQRGVFHRLRITSAGGDALAGMSIGLAVRRRNFDVVADRICASACAQYVFVAGRGKFIARDTFVAFHSSPTAAAVALARSPLRDSASLFSEGRAREKAFYDELGIDARLPIVTATLLRPVCVSVRGGVQPQTVDDVGVGWASNAVVLSRHQLKALGVRNLNVDPASREILDGAMRATSFRSGFRVEVGEGALPLELMSARLPPLPLCPR